MAVVPSITEASVIQYTGAVPRSEVIEKYSECEESYLQYVFTLDSPSVVIIDGNVETYKPMEAAPFVKHERVMLPLRYVAQALGAEVEWDEAERTARFTRNGITASIAIEGNEIVLSNGTTYDMDAAPEIVNGRMFISITNVAKVFGLTAGNNLDNENQDIEWDAVGKVNTIVYLKKFACSVAEKESCVIENNNK